MKWIKNKLKDFIIKHENTLKFISLVAISLLIINMFANALFGLIMTVYAFKHPWLTVTQIIIEEWHRYKEWNIGLIVNYIAVWGFNKIGYYAGDININDFE